MGRGFFFGRSSFSTAFYGQVRKVEEAYGPELRKLGVLCKAFHYVHVFGSLARFKLFVR